MGFWGHRLWHPSVHKRFKDRLVFYRAQARPFSSKRIRDGLSALIAKKKLHNLNAFVIFGPYDLLLRGWLHTSVIPQLEYMLAGELGIRVPESFLVEHEYGAESDLPDTASPQLWSHIEYHQTIRAIQDGESGALLDELIEKHLVTEPRGNEPERIRFYIEINM